MRIIIEDGGGFGPAATGSATQQTGMNAGAVNAGAAPAPSREPAANKAKQGAG